MTAYLRKATTQNWRTPPEEAAVVKRALGGRIDLGPSGHPKSVVGARRQMLLSRGEDAFTTPWGRARTVYINPPFNDLLRWTKLASERAAEGREVIMLLPPRTDTQAWQLYVSQATAICLWKGRIHFLGAKWQAPFACCFALWTRGGFGISCFRRAFEPHGIVLSILTR